MTSARRTDPADKTVRVRRSAHELPDVDLELFDIDIDWTGIETVGSLSAIVEEVRTGAKFDKFDTAEVLQRVIERCQQPHAKDQEAERSWISTAYFELTEQMRWAAAGGANMHFRVPLVRQVFERLLEVARLDRSMAGQGDQIVQDLAWIVVPRHLDLTLQQIVELRRNSDAFASWRTELRSALTCVDSLPLANQDWRAAARFQMRESLQPVAQQIDRELARSTFLSKARTGVGAFSVSALGTFAVLSMGGKLAPALVSSSTSGAATALASYVSGSVERRRNRAVLSHDTSVLRALPK